MEKSELKEAVNESIKELLAESQMGAMKQAQEQKNLNIRKISNGFLVANHGSYSLGGYNSQEVYCSNIEDLLSFIRGELS